MAALLGIGMFWGVSVWGDTQQNGSLGSGSLDEALDSLAVTVVVDPTGTATVSLDLEARKPPSERRLHVDENVDENVDGRVDGDGSPDAPFADLPDAFAHIDAEGHADALIFVAPGEYSWGDAIDPELGSESFDADLTIIGSGSDRTRIVQREGDTAAAVFRESGRSLYLEGVELVGRGAAGTAPNEHVLDARGGRELTLVDVALRDATAGDGLLALNFDTVVVARATATGNAHDGFSYANPLDDDGPMRVLEVAAFATGNGRDGEPSSQGSTTHRATEIIRVGGRYEGNPTNIEDTGLTSWNIDLSVSDPTVVQRHDGGPVNVRVRAGKIDTSTATVHLVSGSYDSGGVIHAHTTRTDDGVYVFSEIRYSPLMIAGGRLAGEVSADPGSSIAAAAEGAYARLFEPESGFGSGSGRLDASAPWQWTSGLPVGARSLPGAISEPASSAPLP